MSAIGFLSPWILAGLVLLPVIWWLLRLTPPAPNRIAFPPTWILKDIQSSEKTPAHSPWWLTLLRMLAAALIILALAGPILNPEKTSLGGSGPILMIVDNGWASAKKWEKRQLTLRQKIDQARQQGRLVALLPTAGSPGYETIFADQPVPATKAVEIAASLKPMPFAANRAALIAPIEKLRAKHPKSSVIWLSDPLVYKKDDTDKFSAYLVSKSWTEKVIIRDKAASPRSVILKPTQSSKNYGKVFGLANQKFSGHVLALDGKDKILGRIAFEKPAGRSAINVPLALPLELANQVSKLRIEGEQTAGSVYLVDNSARRLRVGLVGGSQKDKSQPLLSATYYLEKAIRPFAEISRVKGEDLSSTVQKQIGDNAAAIFLADIGLLDPNSEEILAGWLNKGGTLIRFAGPRMEQGGDELMPVELRGGQRTLGGALSWTVPQKLATFEKTSPFFGINVPQDVEVKRQVLADPAALTDKTEVWARLSDGTPLVTAKKFGSGKIVLFHVTGNADWSSLPHTGLFVEMLKTIVNLSPGVTQGSVKNASGSDAGNTSDSQSNIVLSPLQLLDGFGKLGQADPTVRPLQVTKNLLASAISPPGFYGRNRKIVAVNLMNEKSKLKALDQLPKGFTTSEYVEERATMLRPWLLLAALLLLILDTLVSVAMRGWGKMGQLSGTAASLFLSLFLSGLFFVLVLGDVAQAQIEHPGVPDATLNTRFGYVLTGDPQTDLVSKQGLSGLSRIISMRTALEPGEPIGVNVAKDDLSFFPVLYWPVLDNAKPMTSDEVARVNAYMKNGGMVVFDTKSSIGNLSNGSVALRRLANQLDIPPLEPVVRGHVLTRSFYLLTEFPGRWQESKLWVEAGGRSQPGQPRVAKKADGVSSILITSNDFASAWALDRNGRPLYAVSPGGTRQREMAYRTGVNITMYALTGNYKADQVHIPAFLERLGQ